MGIGQAGRLRGHAAWSLPALLLSLLLAGCNEVPVAQGLPEGEANHVLAVLDRAGLAACKGTDEGGDPGRSTFHVSVAHEQVARAVEVLRAHELPRREEPGFAETYGRASLVQSATEERARAAQALGGELARSLESIDGVLDARVHVALVDERELPLDGQAPPRPSASVLIKYAGPRAPYGEDAVRRLVAAAVQGLRPEDVSVLGIARSLPAPARGRMSGAASSWDRTWLRRSAMLNVVLAATALVLAALRLRRKALRAP